MATFKAFDKLAKSLEGNCEVKELLQETLNSLWNKADQERSRALKKDDYSDYNYFTGCADAAYNLMVRLGIEPLEEDPAINLEDIEEGQDIDLSDLD